MTAYNNKNKTNDNKIINNDNEIYSDILLSEQTQHPISDPFTPASELESNSIYERFSTGAKSLDNLLGGGLEPKTITQFYGPPGSGKTQLCFTLCSVLPSHFKILFIDTEGTFRPERIEQIIKTRDTNVSLQNILVSKVSTTVELENRIDSTDKKIQLDPTIKLLIIDSMTNLYRAEYVGPMKLSQRQQQLTRYMHKLRQLAQSKKLVVVITNQVYSDFSQSYNRKDIPFGGYSISYPCTNIIKLSKSNNDYVTAELIKNPNHALDMTYLYINKQGVLDDEETIKRMEKNEKHKLQI